MSFWSGPLEEAQDAREEAERKLKESQTREAAAQAALKESSRVWSEDMRPVLELIDKEMWWDNAQAVMGYGDKALGKPLNTTALDACLREAEAKAKAEAYQHASEEHDCGDCAGRAKTFRIKAGMDT